MATPGDTLEVSKRTRRPKGSTRSALREEGLTRVATTLEEWSLGGNVPDEGSTRVGTPEEGLTRAAATLDEWSVGIATPHQGSTRLGTPEEGSIRSTSAIPEEGSTRAALSEEWPTRSATPEDRSDIDLPVEWPPHIGTPEEGSTHTALPEEGSTHIATPEGSIGGATPEEGSTPIATPEQWPSQSTTPEEGSTRSATPEEGSTRVATPEQWPSQSTTPEEGSTHSTTSEEGSTRSATPEEGSTRSTTPEEGSTRSTTPDEGSTRSTTPDEGSTRSTTPDLEEGFTHSTTPIERSTHNTIPDEGSTRSATPEGTSEPPTTSAPQINDLQRSIVRSIQFTTREQPQEETVHYSSSSSDSDSDSNDGPTPQPNRSPNATIIPSPTQPNGPPNNAPSPAQHSERPNAIITPSPVQDNERPNATITPSLADVRLQALEVPTSNNNVQHTEIIREVRLRARPNRVVWEPEFKQKATRKKATKAIKNVIKIKPPGIQTEKVKKDGCFERFKKRIQGGIDQFKERFKKKKTEEKEEEPEEEEPTVELSPEMEKANGEGYDMMKKVFFPSMPAVFQDLWVYLELAISIAAFVVGFLGGDDNLPSSGFEYFYLTLACIAMIMALIDGFIYFFQLGSCARGIKFCISVYKNRNRQGEEEEDDDEEEEPQKRCGMSPELQEKFNTWFELSRNLINEFLVYPLLVLDLFDYITQGIEESYVPEEGDALGGTNFGFFVIGSFYLILAVYIMRVVMVFGTLLSLIRLPSSTKASGTDKNTSIMIKFCLHVLGQIFVHFIIIIVIATKIRNENDPETLCIPSSFSNLTADLPTMDAVQSNDMLDTTISNDMVATTDVMSTMIPSVGMDSIVSNDTMDEEEEDGGDPIASPFLIASIVLGGILPLCGVTAFFVVNYFWMREFSIGFWLNMLSMLQGASFAETVFGGDGLSSAEEQANEFLDDSGFDAVKAQISRYKDNTFWTKFFYPTKVPWVALCGVLYDLALVAFVATLSLRYDALFGVRVAIFCDDPALTSAVIMSAVVLFITNIHVLMLLNFLVLLIIIFIVAACLYSLAMLPILLFIYLPIVGLLGYFLLFKDLFCWGGKSKKQKIADGNLTIVNPSVANLDYDFEMDDKKSSEKFNIKDDTIIIMKNDGSIDSADGPDSPMVLSNKSKFESYV